MELFANVSKIIPGLKCKATKKNLPNFLYVQKPCSLGSSRSKTGGSSPYFFNSSKFNTGLLIEELGRYYASAIEENAPNCSLIFGPAYKGIPLCVSAATALSSSLNQNIGYFFNRKEKKTHGDQGSLVGQLPLAKDSVVMVDDVITDGLTKIESVAMIRKLCGVKFSGVLVALDRMEKNALGRDSIADFEQITGVPVWSVITIREVCDYLKNREIHGAVVLDEDIFLKIEHYLEEHSVR